MMKTASTNDIKQELIGLAPKQVLELCLRLVKSKKENKELLSYLLFEAHDPHGYVEQVKQEIDKNMSEIPLYNMYQAKKGLRSILRSIAKYSKHIGTKQAAADMYIHFCRSVKKIGLPMHRSTAITNLYKQQIKKINQLVETLHEDLRYDYTRQLEEL